MPVNDTTRARLLYCMDFIMHHMADDEAASPWLSDGVPDGLFQESQPPPAEEYENIVVSDEEFDEHVALFTRTLVGEVYPGVGGLYAYNPAKGVLF